jgi:hypothetical protein
MIILTLGWSTSCTERNTSEPVLMMLLLFLRNGSMVTTMLRACAISATIRTEATIY